METRNRGIKIERGYRRAFKAIKAYRRVNIPLQTILPLQGMGEPYWGIIWVCWTCGIWIGGKLKRKS